MNCDLGLSEQAQPAIAYIQTTDGPSFICMNHLSHLVRWGNRDPRGRWIAWPIQLNNCNEVGRDLRGIHMDHFHIQMATEMVKRTSFKEFLKTSSFT